MRPVLVVRSQHSLPTRGATFANVGIKGPLANYRCWWSFGFDVRIRKTPRAGSERQIRSTSAAECRLLHLTGPARQLHDVAALAADQSRVLADRQRLADQIALHGVAILRGEEGELLPGFDAFGHDRHVETVGEIDHRADDRSR